MSRWSRKSTPEAERNGKLPSCTVINQLNVSVIDSYLIWRPQSSQALSKLQKTQKVILRNKLLKGNCISATVYIVLLDVTGLCSGYMLWCSLTCSYVPRSLHFAPEHVITSWWILIFIYKVFCILKSVFSRPFYLYNGKPYTCFHIETRPRVSLIRHRI